MFRHTYETMNEKLEPGEELVDSTLGAMARRRNMQRETGRGRRVRPGRVLAVALAAVLVLALSLTAVAAAVPGFNQFLQSLLPQYGNYMQPISALPESPGPAVSAITEEAGSGITLNVLAAASDSDNAAVYYTLTDPQGRLNGATRIAGRLELDGKTVPFTALPVDYDPETQTATYCQRLTEISGIDGSSASLTVTAILGGRQETRFSLDLGSLELDPAPATLSYPLSAEEDTLAQTYESRYQVMVQDGAMTFLQPKEGKPLTPEVDGVQLTGAAYVGDKLHVQLRLSEYWRTSVAHSGGGCSDPDFEPSDPSSYHAFSFVAPFQLGNGAVTKAYDGVVEGHEESGFPIFRLGNEYLEIVDTIPEEALQYWSWSFSLFSYETAVKGPWTQSFTLNSASDSVLDLTGPFVVQVGTKYLPEDRDDPNAEFPSTYAPSTIDHIHVTPFAVTVSRRAAEGDETPVNDGILKRIAPDISKLEVTVQTAEGDYSYPLDPEGYTIVPDSDGNMTARYVTDTPIDPGDITALTVNGVEIPLE